MNSNTQNKVGRPPLDKKGKNLTHYWLFPETRKKIRHMGKEWKKPLGIVVQLIVDKAYEIFTNEKPKK